MPPDPRFQFQATADESPTLRLSSADGTGSSEAMHSLMGAYSETAYIYGTAIETMLAKGFAPRILSMGLGLGYVELLATALFIKSDREAEAEIESFEIVPELRDYFVAWLRQENTPADFARTYDQIIDRTATETGVNRREIKISLAALHREGRWRLREALDAKTRFTASYGCICFDAFSSKTSPDLWTEEFLKEFLLRAA